MRRSALFAVALSLILFAQAGFAQQHEHGATAAPAAAYAARGHSVTFHSSPGEGMAYLSLPADKSAKHPALIVIQEWWGLNDWIKQQTDRFASLCRSSSERCAAADRRILCALPSAVIRSKLLIPHDIW